MTESKDSIRIFLSVKNAKNWVDDQVDDPCKNNYRFSFADDPVGMKEYEERKADGCCGSRDYVVYIWWRKAYCGLNYGH